MHHKILEVFLLLSVGKLTLKKQIANFEVVAVAGKLFDWITAIEQLSGSSVNIGDRALAGSRAQETRIVGELARLLV